MNLFWHYVIYLSSPLNSNDYLHYISFNFVLFICYFIFNFFKAKLSLDKAILLPTYECAICGQKINCMK